MKPPVKALSFDVDGTLFDLRQMKIVFALPAIRNARLLRAYLAAREQVRVMGKIPDVRGEQARLVADALGIATGDAQARIAKLIDGEWMNAFKHVKPFKGVREALSAFHAKGIPMLTLSDYPAARKLAGMKLDHVPWAADICAEDLGALKPHPVSFEHAVKTLGLAPEEILHVGDRLDADIAGAHAAGMRAALFTAGNARKYAAPPGAREPELVFDDFAKLRELVGA